ncbi:unnamed protein product [Arctogadus glacialis]
MPAQPQAYIPKLCSLYTSPGLDHRPDGKAGLMAKTPASRRTARNDRFLNTLPKNQSRREAAEELGTLLGRPPGGIAVVISNNSKTRDHSKAQTACFGHAIEEAKLPNCSEKLDHFSENNSSTVWKRL